VAGGSTRSASSSSSRPSSRRSDRSTGGSRIHLGCCADCGCRVQPRDRRQTSDAVGAAAVQIGPNALAFAALLNKLFGLSWDKIAGLYRRVFEFAVAASTLYRAAARLAVRNE